MLCAMEKRVIATALWFLAILFMYELAWSLFGVPRVIGPVLAGAAAAFVAFDPVHLFWPVREGSPTPRQVASPKKRPLRSPTKA